MSEADEIRELAERFLSHAAPDGHHAARLIAGRLPDGVDLPMPAGARLIGSLVREPGYQTDRDIEVVLDATGSEREVLDFYEQALKRLGWMARPEFQHHAGGFSAWPFGEGRMMRKEGEGIALFINAQPMTEQRTEVRIRTQWFPLDAEFRGPPHHGQDSIPPLRPPAGVRLQDQGGGGGDGSWTSNATAETTQTVAELESHFAGQLAEAGWKRVNGSAAGPLAWSSWALPDGDRIGYLFVLEAPGENRRALWVKTESPRRGHGGGWLSSTSALGST